MKYFGVLAAVLITLVLLVVLGMSIAKGITVWFPPLTAEQQSAKAEAARLQDEQEHRQMMEREQLRLQEEAQKSESTKQAEIIKGGIDDAVGAYVGLEILKAVLR